MTNLTPRRLRPLLLLALAALGLAAASPASASHLRYANVSWAPRADVGAGTVDFTITVGVRRTNWPGSAGDGYAAVGDVIQEFLVEYGDGQTDSLDVEVTAINASQDWLIGRGELSGGPDKIVRHAYAGAGPYSARVWSSARVGTLLNASGVLQVQSIVTPTLTNRSPVASVPPIVTCTPGATCEFFAIAADPDRDIRRWRLSTGAEAGGSLTQPAGLSVNATTGRVTWDTTGRTPGLYASNITIEDVTGTGVVKSKAAVDFILNLDSTPGTSPAFVAPTPADGSELPAQAGQPLTFSLAATDPDVSAVVALGDLGLPAGMACPYGAPGASTSVTCTWTPSVAAAGENLVVFTATDETGRSNLVSLSVNVGTNSAPQAADGTFTTPEDVPLAGTVQVSDPDGDPFVCLLVGAPSAGTSIFTNAAHGDFLYTPFGDAHGTDTFTFQAGDGSLSSPTRTATVNVTPVNDAPTIGALATQTIVEDGTTGPLAITIGDVETPAGTLAVAARAANRALVPADGLVLGGEGANRTLTVTPAANAHGTTSVTVAVTDADGTVTTTTFGVIVQPVADEDGVREIVDGTRVPVATDGTATRLDASAIVLMGDGEALGGGAIVVGFVGGNDPGDVFSVASDGPLQVAGSIVTYAGVTIANLSGGANGEPLRIELVAGVTPDAVRALLRALAVTAGGGTRGRLLEVAVKAADGAVHGSLRARLDPALTVRLARPGLTARGGVRVRVGCALRTGRACTGRVRLYDATGATLYGAGTFTAGSAVVTEVALNRAGSRVFRVATAPVAVRLVADFAGADPRGAVNAVEVRPAFGHLALARSRTVLRADGSVLVRVRCAGHAALRCAGDVTHAGSRATLALTAGQSRVVRLVLTPAERLAVARAGSARVALHVAPARARGPLALTVVAP